MKSQFERVAIIGVGLLGGSLGLALKTSGLAQTIRGVGRNTESLNTAKESGAIDECSLDLVDGVRDADLVVICTPAANVPHTMDAIRDACAPHAIVTDVASTKAAICAHAEATWQKPLRFIGSHPMAGSEKYGPENAYATLFSGSTVLVCTNGEVDQDALETIRTLWGNLGATVVNMNPELHDSLVARTSHIPHILASCVAELAAAAGDVRPVVGSGFRDITRVAAGRSELWRDICLTNREAIVDGLKDLSKRIDEVCDLIAADDGESLDRFFQSAQHARSKAIGK